MREFNLIFNKRIFEFAINDLIKNISFVINEIKIVKIVFDKLLVFVIAINKYNNIILFDCEYVTFFVYYVINN